jgi:hypothetical protein
MTYEIRTGIELPKISNRGRAGASKYPFAQMEIGNSFIVTDRTARTVRSAVNAFQKRYEAKFAVRVTEDGVGVWRIS